jgi:hypothetical protein
MGEEVDMTEDLKHEQTDNGHIWRRTTAKGCRVYDGVSVYVCERCGTIAYDQDLAIIPSCDLIIAHMVITN